MKYVTAGLYTRRGYTISRGSYVGTTDDRLDRWYIDKRDSDTWDRRGPGYRTLAECRDAIDAPYLCRYCNWLFSGKLEGRTCPPCRKAFQRHAAKED